MVQIHIPPAVRALMGLLEGGGYEAYVVGGCVRDSLLGRTPHDWDICTSAAPEESKACFAARGVRTIDTGIRHGTVTALTGGGQFEVTTFRVDGAYSDSRRPDRVEFVSRIEQDLSRRDFTINAMAYNDRSGLVDLFGGAEDLRNGIISCVGVPADRFREDPLRIMRALRFASAYEYSIGPETSAALRACAPLLNKIAAERINTELCGLLRGAGVLRVLLDYSDVLATVIPELGPCIGFEHSHPCHCHNVYDHIAHAVASDPGGDLSVKLALLLHDTGKPSCCTGTGPDRHFYGHAAVSRTLAEAALDRLRFDRQTRQQVAELVLYHDEAIEPTPKTVRRWLNKIGPDRFRQLLQVQRADTLAHAPQVQGKRLARCEALERILSQILAAEQCFSLKDLRISGRDLLALGIPEGKEVGRVLDLLLARVLDGALENDRALLLAEAEALCSGSGLA